MIYLWIHPSDRLVKTKLLMDQFLKNTKASQRGQDKQRGIIWGCIYSIPRNQILRFQDGDDLSLLWPSWRWWHGTRPSCPWQSLHTAPPAEVLAVPQRSCPHHQGDSSAASSSGHRQSSPCGPLALPSPPPADTSRHTLGQNSIRWHKSGILGDRIKSCFHGKWGN